MILLCKGGNLILTDQPDRGSICNPNFWAGRVRPTNHDYLSFAESGKMKPAMSVLFSLMVAVLLMGCRSPYYADKGAALGGVAGGLAGAALGDQSGHAVGGALMGSAVGALTGSAIGDSMDAEVDRRQAVAQTQRRLANAVSTTDVNAMVVSGLGDDVIINHIRANGVRASLTPGDIIELHENGVSEKVINAMQQEAARQNVSPVVVGGPPVIIEESYVMPPYYGPSPYRHYRYPAHAYRRPPGVSWGFSYAR